MTENEKRLLVTLAWMSEQYLNDLHDPEGVLDHRCISAGEGAVELLVEYGLLEPAPRGGRWAEAGKAF